MTDDVAQQEGGSREAADDGPQSNAPDAAGQQKTASAVSEQHGASTADDADPNVWHTYLARLRCRTWHSWPPHVALQSDFFDLELQDGLVVKARAALISHEARNEPHDYSEVETKAGQLMWRGAVEGLFLVRDTALKDPDDVTMVSMRLANAHRGEIDLGIGFRMPGALPKISHESLRRAALGLLSLINLQLRDYLIPTAPLQVAKILAGTTVIDSSFAVYVQKRDALERDVLQRMLTEYSTVVFAKEASPGLRVALELYGSHFSEVNPQTRFLLLVMALEALAAPTVRGQRVQELVDQWSEHASVAASELDADSPARAEVEDLRRGLQFLREGSIRGRVRELARAAASPDADKLSWGRRAAKVYDKRSELVHDGSLPAAALAAAEKEARLVLEMVLSHYTAKQS